MSFVVLKMLGCIALMMFGMKAMSEALQKMAGPQLRHLLGTMTSNRFSGVATGALVTMAVQSSAATTVMAVSFVNASLLTLSQAISVIMGANIGTTLSAWVMSAGFSFDITALVWPGFLAGIALIQHGRYRYAGDFLFGLGFLLFALSMLKSAGTEMDLGGNPAVLSFFAGFRPGYGTVLLFLFIGSLLTAAAQSSAALMAITMALCGSGVIDIYQGIALVMGENVGTTVTANLAAVSAGVQARRTAFAHLLFNVFGVCWVLAVFFPFVRAICGFAGLDPEEGGGLSATRLSFALASFHTAFNVLNTLMLIGLVPWLEQLVCRIITPRKAEEETEFRLEFIKAGIMKTPEISVLQAQKEIGVFGERMRHMFSLVGELYGLSDHSDFQKAFARITKYEEMSDRMENEIGRYLGEVGQAHLSDETKEKIRSMLRQIGELESVGDSCFSLARILERRRERKISFAPQQDEGISEMAAILGEALDRMVTLLKGRRDQYDIRLSIDCEVRLNEARNRLKQRNIESLDEHLYGYASGTVYMDLLGEMERMGDYVINVVQARMGEE